VDREDLKNQIAIWKGNLAYADLAGASLPEASLNFASQAVHPNPDYLRAYRMYEQIRQQRRLITFDDMLMMGWEMMLCHPELLHAAQSRYRCVVVDEFQDVNYSQYQILELLTQPHQNYMAIGDDDQCIYEWRGASPAFILNFEKNHGARVYTISDNFRSNAQQILLANAVISQNRQRYPKFLSLTRGFGGETCLLALKDDWQIARSLAGTVLQHLDKGVSTADMAVLIRLYSQTAFLETAFMEREIPY
jgi:DNA helicase-2/ATP-dependent DNA helicase PcrA